MDKLKKILKRDSKKKSSNSKLEKDAVIVEVDDKERSRLESTVSLPNATRETRTNNLTEDELKSLKQENLLVAMSINSNQTNSLVPMNNAEFLPRSNGFGQSMIPHSYSAGAVINIAGSNDVHIGPTTVINMSAKKSSNQNSKESKKSKSYNKVNEILLQEIMQSEESLITDDDKYPYFNYISQCIGKKYKFFARQLGVEEAIIEQIEITNSKLDIAEVIYKICLSWAQSTEEPTLGKFSTALYKSDKNAFNKLVEYWNRERKII